MKCLSSNNCISTHSSLSKQTMSTIQDQDDNKSDSSVSLSDDESNNSKLKDKKEKLFIEFMTYSNEYIKLRHQMHVNLARGHLNMARGSRSTMNKTPGKLRKYRHIFNKEMVPITCINQNKSGEFALEQKKKSKSTLINRKKEILESKDDNDIDIVAVDPIEWFGAMVPKPIYSAQTDFKNCVYGLIEMANIKQKLDELSSDWEQLLN